MILIVFSNKRNNQIIRNDFEYGTLITFLITMTDRDAKCFKNI